MFLLSSLRGSSCALKYNKKHNNEKSVEKGKANPTLIKKNNLVFDLKSFDSTVVPLSSLPKKSMCNPKISLKALN